MIRNRKNNENRRKKRLADLEASGKTARTKRSKFQKKEKQLQTSTGGEKNELLLYDPPSDSNGEFLHNDSNRDSLSGLGFDFSEYDNKENDYTNFSKGNAYLSFIISYLELLLQHISLILRFTTVPAAQ